MYIHYNIKEDKMMNREINLQQTDPYTCRKRTVVKNGVAIKDYWVLDFAGYRHFVRKGTIVDERGLPLDETLDETNVGSTIKELKDLLSKMQNITAQDEYFEEVGFQSDWDNQIMNALDELYMALKGVK